MNKLLTLLFIPFLFAISSCQKNENIVIPNQTILVDVKANEWTSSDGGVTFSTTVDMPEISSDFNQMGGVLVYVSFGGQTYEQVPQVFNGISYSYSSAPGSISIDIQSALGDEVISPPGQSIRLKIILIESI